MIILKPNTTLQGFTVTPRNQTILLYGNTYQANKMKLTDEETGVVRIVDIAGNEFSVDYYYHTYNVTFNPALKEGHTYKVKLYVVSEIYETWRGKLFCTDKIIETEGYSVNEDKFIENTTTNQFILND
jgi:hypothetical protein